MSFLCQSAMVSGDTTVRGRAQWCCEGGSLETTLSLPVFDLPDKRSYLHFYQAYWFTKQLRALRFNNLGNHQGTDFFLLSKTLPSCRPIVPYFLRLHFHVYNNLTFYLYSNETEAASGEYNKRITQARQNFIQNESEWRVAVISGKLNSKCSF